MALPDDGSLIRNPGGTDAHHTQYYGQEYGAKIVELRKGSISEVTIGTISREPIFGTMTFHPRRTVKGVLAKKLGCTLREVILNQAKGVISGNVAIDQIDKVVKTISA